VTGTRGVAVFLRVRVAVLVTVDPTVGVTVARDGHVVAVVHVGASPARVHRVLVVVPVGVLVVPPVVLSVVVPVVVLGTVSAGG
jgi:hypothetical protein